MKVEFSAKTDIGLVRKKNEDFIFFDNDHLLALLADGVGGESHGELASKLAVESSYEKIKEKRDELPPQELVFRAFEHAQKNIEDFRANNASIKGVLTTLDCMYFSEKNLYFGHTGDGRIYRISRGKIKQLTSDHNVKTFISQGLIEEENYQHLRQDALLKVVGTKVWEPDLDSCVVEKGDIFFCASDGLFGMLSDTEMLNIIEQPISLNEMTENLIFLAKKAGGTDNISLIIAKVCET